MKRSPKAKSTSPVKKRKAATPAAVVPKRAAPGKKKPAAKSLYKMPEPMPLGEILTDTMKKKWKLGRSIGKGGFGEIYLAAPSAQSVTDAAEHVVKIEPSDNGPLFCEINFYARVAKADIIRQWKSSHKHIHYVGIPPYIASGLHNRGKKDYRFLVMPRFSRDVEHLFNECKRKFTSKTVTMLSLRLIDTLEFLHENGYVHMDIKGSNLLTGFKKEEEAHIYLVDYGLVHRRNDEKKYKEDPRKAHDGTIEFTSIDAHKGVEPARRGDLEILGYVVLQWLCGRLPWEDCLANPARVKEAKIDFMSDLKVFLPSCFGKDACPGWLLKYFLRVKQLTYEAKPDYAKLRKIVQDGMKAEGLVDDGVFDWMPGAVALPKAKKSRKRRSDPIAVSDEEEVRTPSPRKKKKVAASKPKSSSSPKKTVAGRGRVAAGRRGAVAQRKSPRTRSKDK
ncbi:serine/threonine-protein kinase VRK1-like isoform X2 [Oscarella lobularis]|uniref:serine/threonine-protein kinase VRK1-like isoform X2 n=1 Tax=Oscarella lobularis TaxID=121494 RepID=UPI00331424B9